MTGGQDYLVLSAGGARWALPCSAVKHVEQSEGRCAIIAAGARELRVWGFSDASITHVESIVALPALLAGSCVHAIAWPDGAQAVLVLDPLSLEATSASLPLQIGVA